MGDDAGADALPTVLDPSPEATFTTALLRQGNAWIVEIYRDGRREIRRWNAARLSESSRIFGNLRTRPRYRKGTWEQLGLKSLIVSIRQPRTDVGTQYFAKTPNRSDRGKPLR